MQLNVDCTIESCRPGNGRHVRDTKDTELYRGGPDASHTVRQRIHIERDLSATSLWSQSTRAQVDLTETDEHPKCITSAGIAPYLSSSGASSSSDVQPSRDLDFVSTHDIACLAEHFLGPPNVLQNLCPAVKFSSKMRSVPEAHLYLQPPPPPAAQPKRGGGSSPWVRDAVWDRSDSDSDDG